MGTIIRPELSYKNPYYISKHNYYELLHFCRQYQEWEKEYNQSIINAFPKGAGTESIISGNGYVDSISDLAVYRASLKRKMELVQETAKETDPMLSNYIFEAVTKGLSYTNLKTAKNIPCCKDEYYRLYHKFFWLLKKER